MLMVLASIIVFINFFNNCLRSQANVGLNITPNHYCHLLKLGIQVSILISLHEYVQQ
jgi:hypothetical protein